MKKINGNRAITRKDFALYCAWAVGFVVLVYAALAVREYWSHIKAWFGKMKDKIRTKLPW